MMGKLRRIVSDVVIKGLSPFLHGAGCILGLHRVLPDPLRSSLQIPRDLEVSTAFLDEVLDRLRARGLEFVSLDRFMDNLREGRARGKIVVTLDDGYRDNLEFALPVFEKHEVPFVVYATVGLIDGTVDPWWYSLQTFLSESETVRIPGLKEREVLELPTADPESEERAYDVIYGLVRSAGPGGASLMGRFWALNGLEAPPATEGLFLSWEELVQLGTHPLATIGAHTVNHPRLSWLQPEEVRRELHAGRDRLEKELGVPVKHVAYPHGGVGDVPADIGRLAREAGYETGVLAVPRPVRWRDADRPWTLPRAFISGCDQRIGVVERQISGFEVLRSRGLREDLKKMEALR